MATQTGLWWISRYADGMTRHELAEYMRSLIGGQGFWVTKRGPVVPGTEDFTPVCLVESRMPHACWTWDKCWREG